MRAETAIERTDLTYPTELFPIISLCINVNLSIEFVLLCTRIANFHKKKDSFKKNFTENNCIH